MTMDNMPVQSLKNYVQESGFAYGYFDFAITNVVLICTGRCGNKSVTISTTTKNHSNSI